METPPENATPVAGEVWDAVLDPTRGREQAGYRPVLVVSNNQFNARQGSLVLVTPITGTEAKVRYQIEIPAGEGGVSKQSTILPEQIRAIDVSRLKRRRGQVRPEILDQVRRMVILLVTD